MRKKCDKCVLVKVGSFTVENKTTNEKRSQNVYQCKMCGRLS